MQDNERNGGRQGLTDAVSGAGSGTVTSLRIARIQRAPLPTPPVAVSEPVSAAPRLDSRSLFGASREVVITHDGAEYRLRLTASGKLILTK